MKLRDKAQQFVQWQIGTGEHVYFWYDNWHPKGPLLKAYGAGILRYSCLNDMVKVSKIITEHHWDWPNRLFHDLQEKMNIAELETRPSDEEKIKWSLSPTGMFTIKSAWKALGPRK